MKKHYALLSIVGSIALPCLGQVGVLTSDEMLPPGSIVIYQEATVPSFVDTTDHGTNAHWDLSGLQASGSPYTYNVLAPSSTPFVGSMPASANYAVYESIIPRYSYFSLTAESFQRVGYHVNSVATYSDPQQELVFPVMSGNTNTDEWANNDVTFPGTYGYTCIGSGMLNLPGATYNDVLLLRVVVHNIFTQRQYVWVDATTGTFLASYLLGSFFMPALVQYASNVSIGIHEVAADMDLRVHSHAQDQLMVTYSANHPVDWTILDMAGRTLLHGTWPGQGAARTATLDIGALSTGMHLIQLSNPASGSQRTVRFWNE